MGQRVGFCRQHFAGRSLPADGASRQPPRPCSSGVKTMKIKLASALGLALLAASLTFGSSFACPDTPGTTASALPTAPEADAMDREYLPVQRSATEAPVAEVDQPAAVASVTDRSSTEVAAPSATQSVNAVVADVTQNVTL